MSLETVTNKTAWMNRWLDYAAARMQDIDYILFVFITDDFHGTRAGLMYISGLAKEPAQRCIPNVPSPYTEYHIEFYLFSRR